MIANITLLGVQPTQAVAAAGPCNSTSYTNKQSKEQQQAHSDLLGASHTRGTWNNRHRQQLAALHAHFEVALQIPSSTTVKQYPAVQQLVRPWYG